MLQPDEIDGSAIFEDPDAQMRALLAELEHAENALRLAQAIDEDVDGCREEHRAIRVRIAATPAFNAEGLRAKARAADLAGRRDGLADVLPGSFTALAASLVRDVLEISDLSSVRNLPAPSAGRGR